MPRPRVAMRRIGEVLRLKYELGLSESEQSRGALGPAPERLQSAQAHQEIPRGKARAVLVGGRVASRWRGSAGNGGGRLGDAFGDRRGAAVDFHRLPAKRDHRAEMGVRRSRREQAEPAGFQDRRQGRAHRQAGGRCPLSRPAPPRESLGHHRQAAGLPPVRSAAVLAARPRPRRPQGRPHS